MRRLLDLDIHEVSLVGQPANMRRFLVIKRRETEMDELQKLIEGFSGRKLDDEVVSEGLDAASMEALTKQMTLLSEYRDDLPVDVVKAISLMCHQAAFGIIKADDEPDKPDMSVEDLVGQVVDAATEKFTESNKEVLSKIETVLTELKETLTATETEVETETEVKPEVETKPAVEPDITPEEMMAEFDTRLENLGVSP